MRVFFGGCRMLNIWTSSRQQNSEWGTSWSIVCEQVPRADFWTHTSSANMAQGLRLIPGLWLCRADIMVPQHRFTCSSLKCSGVCSVCHWMFATVSFWSSRKPHLGQRSLGFWLALPSTCWNSYGDRFRWILYGAFALSLNSWDFSSSRSLTLLLADPWIIPFECHILTDIVNLVHRRV